MAVPASKSAQHPGMAVPDASTRGNGSSHPFRSIASSRAEVHGPRISRQGKLSREFSQFCGMASGRIAVRASLVSGLRFRFSSGAEGAGAGGAGAGGVYPGVSPDSAKSFRRPGEGLLNSWESTKNLVIRTYQNVCYLILGLLEMEIVGQVFCTTFLSIV